MSHVYSRTFSACVRWVSSKTFFQNSLRNSTSKLASKKSKEKWRIWFLNKLGCFVGEEWNTKNWNHQLIIFLRWQFHPSNRLITNFSIYTLFWQTFYKHQVLAYQILHLCTSQYSSTSSQILHLCNVYKDYIYQLTIAFKKAFPLAIFCDYVICKSLPLKKRSISPKLSS